MNTLEVEKQKAQRMVRTFRQVKADSSDQLPTRIEILQVGMWDTPYHGMFMIDQDDLNEMKANFDAGIAQAGDGIGLPIDFSHDESGQAAGWIKGMIVEGNSLYADPVEWTQAGKEALLGGNFKCFSPTFYPSCLGGWPDPEDYDTFVPNVITGGALTNIPLFKGLQPIMASVNGKRDKNNTIFISASAEGKKMPTLEEVKQKDVASLTEDEKKILVDNQASLTDEEKVKFGLQAAPTTAPADPDKDKNEENKVTDPETAAIAASVKSGESVVVKASVYNKLQEDVKSLKRKEIAASVATHVARGAIKADQIDKWTDKILADASNEELLKDLPGNKVMSGEVGNDDKAIEASEAQETLHNKVVASATDEKFKGMSYSQRRTVILNDPENKALAASIKESEETN